MRPALSDCVPTSLSPQELLKRPRSLTFTLFCELISEAQPYYSTFPKAVVRTDLYVLCDSGFQAIYVQEVTKPGFSTLF